MIPHRQLFASLPAAVLLAACSSRLAALPRVSPDCKFSMSGDHILCGGALYAQIVRSHCTTRGANPGEAYLVPPGEACRGLGLRYTDGSTVTLFAARSLQMWSTGERYRIGGKSEAIKDWAYDVVFEAPTGRLTFRRPGLLASSRYAYDVGTGILKRVD